jgi:hypothetical protein
VKRVFHTNVISFLGGKHSCVEKDIEVVPMERVLTAIPDDSFGMSKAWPDYVVETTFSWVRRFRNSGRD